MKLEVKNLYKEFHSRNFLKKEKKSVLEDISFALDGGDILGLLGKNGAGKTTLVKIIVGLIEPSEGEIIFENKKKPLFGYANSNPRSFFWRISSRENLIFFGRMLGLNKKETVESIKYLSSILKIKEILDRPFMLLSSGQMQAMNIARALLKKPDFLFLDEPTTSLDYKSSQSIIDILDKYLKENKIPAVWCSHDYSELNRVCNKFGLLKDKKLTLRDRKIDTFHGLANSYEFQVSCDDFEKINTKLNVVVRKIENQSCFFSLKENERSLNDILKLFANTDIKLLSIEKNFEYFEDYV